MPLPFLLLNQKKIWTCVHTRFLTFVLFIILCVWGCMCSLEQVPEEARRKYQIIWLWSKRLLTVWYGCWKSNMCRLKKQHELLTVEQPMQLPCSFKEHKTICDNFWAFHYNIRPENILFYYETNKHTITFNSVNTNRSRYYMEIFK